MGGKQFKLIKPNILETIGLDGLNERKNNHKITMSQKRHIEEILKRFNMEKCKLVEIPFNVKSILLRLWDEEFGNVQSKIEDILYNMVIESLMYTIVSMRINLAFAVSTVSQFMSWVGPLHWMAMKRIMRYLN